MAAEANAVEKAAADPAAVKPEMDPRVMIKDKILKPEKGQSKSDFIAEYQLTETEFQQWKDYTMPYLREKGELHEFGPEKPKSSDSVDSKAGTAGDTVLSGTSGDKSTSIDKIGPAYGKAHASLDAAWQETKKKRGF